MSVLYVCECHDLHTQHIPTLIPRMLLLVTFLCMVNASNNNNNNNKIKLGPQWGMGTKLTYCILFLLKIS